MDNKHYKILGIFLGLAFSLILASPQPSKADNGFAKLRADVWPYESELFIDGKHMGDFSWDGFLTIKNIPPGEHDVEVRNWGYAPQTFKLNFEAGKVTPLRARLEALPGEVSEPLGQIDVHGRHRAAILLNGTTPEYSVAHAGETHGRFHSKLLVPPGTYQMSVVHGDQTYWSGPVTVKEGERTVVDADKGGTQIASAGPMSDPPRMREGVFRSHLAVGKTEASLSAAPGTINCGDSSQLSWTSTDAVHTDIGGIGDVPASGQQQVSPTATTTYTMTAKGPGGEATPATTVTVNKDIDASLTVSPSEVTYPGTATVSWAVNGPGAKSVSVDPLGSVDPSGSKQIEATNEDRTVNYTLHATNACGGDVTRTASLHFIPQAQPAPAPPAAAPEQAAPPAEPPKQEELPKTASQMPLLGLIGLASAGAALAFRAAAKRME